MNKNVISNIIKYFILLILYVILLTVVCIIPKSWIYTNMLESSETLLQLGEKTVIPLANKHVVLFNFTDAIMLNTIYSIDQENPFESAMLARRNYVKEKTEKIYRDTNPPGEESEESANYVSETYQTKELYETVNGRNTYDCIEYARYWHGYMVILRPLLTILNYNQIQIISACFFLIISFVLMYLITKELNTKIMIAFLLSFIFADVFICSISLNAITPFYIGIIGGIYILIRKNKYTSPNFVFLIIGSLTSFFDLLTTPIVSLCIPLILKTLIDIKESNNSIKNIILSVTSWGIGYATTMIFKWIVTDIFLEREVIITSIKQMLYRIGNDADGVKYTILQALCRNGMFLGKNLLIILITITLSTCAIKLMIKRNIFNKDNISILLISVIPICWYIFLKNHSTVHAFFTYRNLVITIICILILLLGNVSSDFKQKKLKIHLEEEPKDEKNF